VRLHEALRHLPFVARHYASSLRRRAGHAVAMSQGGDVTQRSPSGAARHAFFAQPAVPSHVVQFYDDEDFLSESVSQFVGAGLGLGEPAIVVATPAHLEALRVRLAAKSFDVSGACKSGRLTLLDAEETLATFMVGNQPDMALFRTHVGGAVAKASHGGTSCIRVYGEMVDLLMERGEPDAAVRLEQMWNELASEHSFALLCAYVMGRFYKLEDAGHFAHVCDAHARSYPTEMYSTLEGDEARLREISTLQQQAKALATEIERRKHVEGSLRDAMSALRRREEELRDFLENAAEGLHWVRADGIVEWANRSEMALLGYSADEYIGHHISEFHADAQRLDDILGRLSRGEELREYETSLRCKDGSTRHVLITSNVLREEGRFIHTRCFTRDITERKHAEEELKGKQHDLEAVVQRLNAVIAQMPSALALVEAPSGKVLLANDKNETIFRQRNEPMEGISEYRRFVGLHDDGREMEPGEWPLSRSITTGEVIAGEEMEIVRGDGTHGFIRVSSAPIRDDAGGIVGGVVTYDDVTEERSARVRLREQNRINETLLRIGTVLSSELDLEALVQKLTDEATALCHAQFGAFFYNVVEDDGESYSLYTLSGVPREAVAGFPMPRKTAVFEPTFAGTGVLRIEDITKDPRYGKNAPYHGMPKGHPPVCSYLAVPVRSPRGEVLGGRLFGHERPAVFTETDEAMVVAVSAQAAIALENASLLRAARAAEARATRERQKLETLFMQAPALIAIQSGPTHVYELVNAVAAKLLAGRDLLGKPVREAIPEIDRAQVEMLDRVYRTGERQVARELASTVDWGGDGRPYERFFDVVYEAYRDAEGNVAGVMSIGFEVTDQVLARRRVEAIASELENANRTKDEFLATVSHELRTPLNAMLGWVRMLRSGTLPEDKRERALETIERNANAQTQLIDDLLDVSRIISGKLRLDVTTVDLSSVANDAIEAVRPAADARSLTLRQTIDPHATPILGDADRIQQIVWNLLTNAVKFTPKGGTVSLTLCKRESHVEIIVADNGQGIAPEFIDHVFERFRQADATTTRKHGGLGLGLAIVRHLAELHGGTVRVESEGLGKGATFVVCLPISPLRSRQFERLPAVRLVSAVPEIGHPQELVGVHILVVDDEPDARELVSEVLLSCKAKVSTAGSVAEAIDYVTQHRPDVVVSDIGMPGEDGYALIKKLRALPPSEGGKTPAIALTAYARFEDRTKALVAGFNMHITKPVEPTELIATLVSLTALFSKA
jgi:PAS domain S-box-containing protein